jgi:hypothetical protein
MSQQESAPHWTECVESSFACLGKWEARGLAALAFGMDRARHRRFSLVAEALGVLGQPATV